MHHKLEILVWHPGPGPRYALITSWESNPVIDNWIRCQTRPRQLTAVG